ncbi:MAG: RNA methyltransferase [Calditrichia bacterium]
MPTARRLNRMKQVLRYRQPDITVICENITDPHNVSAILRSCDAVGVPAVHLLYTSAEMPEMGKKSSASAHKWVKTVPHRDYSGLKRSLKAEDFRIVATRHAPESQSIYEMDWTGSAAIILGNEHLGVSREAQNISDVSVHIPMFGMVESLNVSVAAAVILYEICRQRLQKGFYKGTAPGADWQQQILSEWIEGVSNNPEKRK